MIGFAVTIMLTAFMVTSVTINSANQAIAQGPPRIVVNLTGNEEVPPVQTEATGTTL